MSGESQNSVFEPACALWAAPGPDRDLYYVSHGVRRGDQFVATGECEPYTSRDAAFVAAQALLRQGTPAYFAEYVDAGRLRITSPCLPQPPEQLQRFVVVSLAKDDDDVVFDVIDATDSVAAAERVQAIGNGIGSGAPVYASRPLAEWAADVARWQATPAQEVEAEIHRQEGYAFQRAVQEDLRRLHTGFEALVPQPASGPER